MAVSDSMLNFPVMNLEEELLRAPTRKRKTGLSDSRRPDRSSVVCTSLDLDMPPQTLGLLADDMGVSMLSDDSELSILENEPQPTPHNPSQTSILEPPGAPRPAVGCPSDLSLSGSFGSGAFSTRPFYYKSPHLEPEDSSSIIRRRWRFMTQAPGPNEWERLPEEVALSVFRWLPKTSLVKCARVCRKFYRLAMDESLWRRLDMSNKNLKPGVVGRVIDRGAAVLRLAKSEIQTPLVKVDHNNSVLSSSLLSCSLNNSLNSLDSSAHLPRLCRLQFLDLSMAVISTSGLEELLEPCRLLRKLSLENCDVNDTICRYVGQNSNLETLNLCMCQGITENGLVHICNNLQRLESLNVGWTNMSRGAVVYLVICLPPCLTKLNLTGCRDTLLDEDVQQLCGSCPLLKELDLSDCTLLSAVSVQHIAESLGGLEYCALSRCYHILPSSLTVLANIHTMLAVDVFGMLKESALMQLKQAMPNIQINKFPFSSIARPTTGIKRTSIWGLRVRDPLV